MESYCITCNIEDGSVLFKENDLKSSTQKIKKINGGNANEEVWVQ